MFTQGGNTRTIAQRMLRRSTATLCACLALAAAPAAAQDLGDPVYYDQGAPSTLFVPVTASVGGRCEFAGTGPSGTYNAGNLDVLGWTHDFGFTISCNTASRVAVISTNGGLKTAGTVTDAGYLGLAPYQVTLNLDGNSVDASGSCAAETLKAGAASPCSFTGPASSTQGLRLTGPSKDQTGSYLRVSSLDYTSQGALVAGSYADTLTVTIAASP